MKKLIKAECIVTVPIVIEFETDSNISESELALQVKNKLDVEINDVLGGADFMDSDVQNITFHEV